MTTWLYFAEWKGLSFSINYHFIQTKVLTYKTNFLSNARIKCSNPGAWHGSMSVFSVCFLFFFLGRDLCDGTIHGPEESYHLCVCVCVCVCMCVSVGACVCVCVCVIERFILLLEEAWKRMKENVLLNKDIMKQHTHTLTYRRSSSKDSEDRYLCP
jgi:hypothetical protein